MRIERHPKLNVWVREDGCIYLPQSGTHKPKWTFGSNNGRGYRQVYIAGKHYLAHRIVAEAFLGPIPEGYEVDHSDRSRSNNAVSNIRIVSSHENHCNTSRHDRVTERGGTHIYEDKKQYKRESSALYRAENKDKIREGQARYYAENRDKVREQHSRYRAEHPEKVRESSARYYANNREKERERHDRYTQDKRKTHRVVYFSDGSRHWIPNEQAEILLLIPVKDRHYGK